MALIDFSSNFLSNTFIFQTFIPFIILFAILWGLLEIIFEKWSSKIKIVISLGFALIASFTNGWILVYIATLGSYMAVVLFGILFLFGVLRWGLSRGHDIYYETSSYQKQYQHLARQKEKIVQKIEGAKSDREKMDLMKTLNDVDNRMKLLQYKMQRTS